MDQLGDFRFTFFTRIWHFARAQRLPGATERKPFPVACLVAKVAVLALSLVEQKVVGLKSLPLRHPDSKACSVSARIFTH